MIAGSADPKLGASKFHQLPLGSVQPRGWLAEQVQLQAEGLTGSLEGLWPDVGPDSAWLGGSGEDWERGPYYLDGLVPLAHVLGDDRLLARADAWVDAILASQRPDGSFGPSTNDDWWPRMVALKAVIQHAEATGDARVELFLGGYFQHQSRALSERPLADWGRARGADNVLSVMWLHERTQEPWLLELAALILDQTADWESFLHEFPCTDITRTWDHMTHVVNVAMGLKNPVVRFLLDGEGTHRQAFDEGLANLDRFHGQVHGMFSGDEWLAGPGATRGVELCAVVEMMYSLECAIGAWGHGHHADRLERLAYNLLPATMTADMTAHQYHQQANQILVTIAQRDWTQAGDDCTIFGLEPNFGCCTANLHQGWPKFVRSMWMEPHDGGIAAVAYGPSAVRLSRPAGAITIEARTAYPFDETVALEIATAQPVEFPLWLRVPGWCDSPRLRVNRSSAGARRIGDYLVLDRPWRDGDLVELRMPMTVRAVPRQGGAAGVSLGPLVLAFSPGEIWERVPGSTGPGDWEVRPRRSWNIALAIEPATIASVATIERVPVGSPPFGLQTGPPPFGLRGVPLKVWLPGRRAPGWQLEGNSASAPPAGTIPASEPDRPVPLVPYGSARLRVAEFPLALPQPTSAPAADGASKA
jgi:hypothetical protein